MDKHNKKGQVGETLTWVVATILVIVLLIFFIFGASLLAGTKKVTGEVFKPSVTSGQVKIVSDTFLQKSLFTYASVRSSSYGPQIDKELENMTAQGEFSLDYNQTKKEILGNYTLIKK